MERFGWAFAPGDKVMQIENDYEGGLQRRHHHRCRSEQGKATASFDERAVVTGELDTLVPAYAATIHKSQNRVPSGGDPGADAALHHAAAGTCSTPGSGSKAWLDGSGWSAEGDRHRGQECVWPCAGWSKLREWLQGITRSSVIAASAAAPVLAPLPRRHALCRRQRQRPRRASCASASRRSSAGSLE